MFLFVPDEPATDLRACVRCGAMAESPAGGLPAGWSLATENRRVEYLCVDCARSNIRAIEAKLPEEWWE